jgi:hypothetical protein
VFPLPPQRQHALGGAGSLPGFGLLALDCGARGFSGVRDGGGARFYDAYGCDRFALFQAEYRGDLSFRAPPRVAKSAAADDDGGLDWSDMRLVDADFGWVLFVDVGAGWTSLERHHDENTAVDLGAGVLLGDVGLYVAAPVRDVYDRGGVSFFIRLAPRF